MYPALLNELDLPQKTPTLQSTSNVYAARTKVNDATKAYACPANAWPFLSGELYLSLGAAAGGGVSAGNNLQTVSVTSKSTVRLNAMLQPAMAEENYFAEHAYGQDPGLLAVGAPALREKVQFYEGTKLLGEAPLAANGTLATLPLTGLTQGTHIITAKYPGDAFYRPYTFGAVSVSVR